MGSKVDVTRRDFFYFRARDMERMVSRALQTFDRAEIVRALRDADRLRELGKREPGIMETLWGEYPTEGNLVRWHAIDVLEAEREAEMAKGLREDGATGDLGALAKEVIEERDREDGSF